MPYAERHPTQSSEGPSNPSLPESTLLNLPLDIRLIIWRLVLGPKQIVTPNVRNIFKRIKALDESGVAFVDLKPERTLAMARICKELHNETLSIYFGLNHFVFNNTLDMYTFLHMIGVRSLHMKKVTFLYQGSCQRLAFGQLSRCTGLRHLDVLVSAGTVKGSRRPRRDLFTARGMQAFRAIKGLVDCKVRVREVVAFRPRRLCGHPRIRTYRYLFRCMHFRDKRRFDERSIKELETVLADEITREVGPEGI